MNKVQRTQNSGTYELLSTKFTSPRVSSSLVSREALLDRLDEGLDYKLTLLSAPAGFGKSTLVSAWIAQRRDRLDVAWVALDTGDNDPVRFWRYVLTACQALQPDLGKSALTLLLTSRPPHFETVLTTFINDCSQLTKRGVLILEDYHAITSPQIHETMAFLLDHLPATLHLVILSRSDPPLPLARLRAHNDLYELHAADLRFSQEEARAFLQQTIPFPLSSEAITRLEARTEGWVTGLRLVALALRGRQEPQNMEHLLATFSGSHRHILEYLSAEVLASQPEPMQEFLLQTSFLSRLTGSLCDAVTGRNDGDIVLEELEGANLFLMPLDDAQQWYRYHALFAEAMRHYARRRLGDAAIRELSHKASLWYEEHGFLADAIEAALAAQQFARAADLLERVIEPEKTNNELYTLRRWIEPLPEEVLRLHPMLCVIYAITLLFTLDRSAPATRKLVEAPLAMAEQYWQAEQNGPGFGYILAVRAQLAWWQGELPQSFAAAREALTLLPEQELNWRGACMISLGTEAIFAGQFDTARQMLLEGRALSEAAGNDYATRAAIFMLANIYLVQGELHQAALLYRQILAGAGEDITDQAGALIGLAELMLEWNDLDAAEQHVSQALDLIRPYASDLGEQRVDEDLLTPGSILQARLLYVRGQREQAQQRLSELIAQPHYRELPPLPGAARLWLARFALAAGDQVTAQRWFASASQHDEVLAFFQRERLTLLQARLLIAQGEIEQALPLLDTLQAEAHTHKSLRNELEIIVLKALASATLNQQKEARQALREVLVLAHPGGYQRLFLDEGETMEVLLRSILPEIKEDTLLTYARTLLAAFTGQKTGQEAPPPTPSELFIEPLSSQERRVLRLLVAGRSNPEMAQELIVSVNTIKTQVKSIFRKLNVNSRQEARDVARRLKLL